jgi:tetratricopeptide (TPR) repeat protein
VPFIASVDNWPVEDAERDRLLAIVVASDEVILDEGDSPDPVAERRVTQALRAKGRALGDLERYAERVLVWEEILARLADNPPTANARITLQALANKAAAERALGRDNNELTTLHALLELAAPGEDTGVLRLVAAALNRKRELLIALERQADAIGVDDEIVRQLNGVDDPNLRTFVAYALTRKSQVLLTMGARFPEAMKASDELVARLEHEPSDTAVTVAELISAHMEHLTRTGQPTPPSILANVSLTLAMMASESASELATSRGITRSWGTSPETKRPRRSGISAAGS